jgi:hypothetical protein
MTKILTAMLALAGTMAAADPATAAVAKPKPYTLDTCVISGDKLGSMGEAVVVVRNDRELKFCCKGCVKDFDKDPAKFLKKIDAAEAKPKAAEAASGAPHH